MINPDSYLKVISHDLRKKILNKLFILTLNEPITKRKLAEAVNIEYESLCYQLNEHLRDFWEVQRTEKIRGAHLEFIAPKYPNTIYLNVGSGGIIYIIDPLANLMGKISQIGTRCDKCSKQQKEKCIESLKKQKCLKLSKSDLEARERVLENNNRSRPFTPAENLIVYTATRALESDGCQFHMEYCDNCQFMNKLLKLKS
jgi:hypothetical protein